MEIEFDPVKDVVNIRKRGISLRRAEDFVSMADHEDGRFDYGEIRYRAYGHIGDVAYCWCLQFARTAFAQSVFAAPMPRR